MEKTKNMQEILFANLLEATIVLSCPQNYMWETKAERKNFDFIWIKTSVLQ